MTPPRESAGAVKSAERALSILELLTRERRALSFGEIATALGYPRSSLHGLLRTLSERGWIAFDDRSRAYFLGLRAWEAGNAYQHAVTLADRALPYMHAVRDALDETVQLSVLDDRDNVYVAKVDGTQRLVLESDVGGRLRAHATGLGKVLLAGLDPDELERRIGGVELERYTAHTVTDHAALTRELERIRREGYAADHEEYTLGVHCVAVPVRGHSGDVVAAMSVSVPTVRLDAERHERTHALLEEAADGLSRALGYRQDAGPTAGAAPSGAAR